MKKVAERGVEVFFTSVFRDSFFFHLTLHPRVIFLYLTLNPAWFPNISPLIFGIVGYLK